MERRRDHRAAISRSRRICTSRNRPPRVRSRSRCPLAPSVAVMDAAAAWARAALGISILVHVSALATRSSRLLRLPENAAFCAGDSSSLTTVCLFVRPALGVLAGRGSRSTGLRHPVPASFLGARRLWGVARLRPEMVEAADERERARSGPSRPVLRSEPEQPAETQEARGSSRWCRSRPRTAPARPRPQPPEPLDEPAVRHPGHAGSLRSCCRACFCR